MARLCADGFIELEELRAGVFGQHATTPDDYQQACAVGIQRGGGPAKEGGDAIQGL